MDGSPSNSSIVRFSSQIVKKYTEPDRLYFFSTHLYDADENTDYTFYPGSGLGTSDEDGSAGNIVNVPLAPQWRAGTVSTAISKSKAMEELQEIKDEIREGRGGRGGRRSR